VGEHGVTETEQTIKIGQDIHGKPVAAWRGPDGRFFCAWIERTHGMRFFSMAETDTLGGKIRGKPTEEMVDHPGDDLEALTDYAEAHSGTPESHHIDGNKS
jgi:hypothetical protein